jgi:hypothetical protein
MPQNSIQFTADWKPTQAVQMGEMMGHLPS